MKIETYSTLPFKSKINFKDFQKKVKIFDFINTLMSLQKLSSFLSNQTGVNINWLLTGEGSMAMADSSTDSQVLPGQLSEVQEKMKRLFDLLLQIDEEKRGVAIAEMLSKVQDAVRMNELERMVKELQKD